METQTSDSPPGEFPGYNNEKIEPADIPQGAGSFLDSQTVTNIPAVTYSKTGPNVLVATNGSGKLPTAIFPVIPVSSGTVRVSMTTYTALATTSTAIPYDNTIPQSSEGGEFMSIAYTPTSATSTLIVEAYCWGNTASAGVSLSATMALFVDAGTNAVAATHGPSDNGSVSSQNIVMMLAYKVSAASTTARTYKIRCGCPTASVFTLNGYAGSGLYNGVGTSWIKVTEVT